MVIIQAPEHPQGSEFDTQGPTMSPQALAHPGEPSFSQIRQCMILLIGLLVKAWWNVPCKSLVELSSRAAVLCSNNCTRKNHPSLCSAQFAMRYSSGRGALIVYNLLSLVRHQAFTGSPINSSMYFYEPPKTFQNCGI